MDEAGRGPVLGPMVICGLAVPEEKISNLIEIGVKDSKKLSPHRREVLAGQIRDITDQIVVKIIPAAEIDAQMSGGTNLNEIEVIAMGAILAELHPVKIYIDAADVNEERFGKNVKEQSGLSDVEVIAEHKADENYPVVGAASIIAKTTRDAEIKKLKVTYGEIGSGYPGDEKTRNFIKQWFENNHSLPPIARWHWKTIGKITGEMGQTRITDY
jgi:ribonuclease HII